MFLGTYVTMVKDALVISLGVAAARATKLLIDEVLLDSQRCLVGFPHPSPIK
jgi:hypothetical protein